MDRDRNNQAGAGVRILISLPFLAAGVVLIKLHNPQAVLGILSLLVGTLLLAPPLLSVITGSAGSIFFPRKGRQQVNLMFSIPESRIMEGKYNEALKLLQDMIPRDPKRLEIYIRIMDLAINKMHQPETAMEALQKGLKKITSRNDKKALKEHYSRLID
ncbi:MAG: tetratricopeptide repeat protein [Candidatus Fermentibacteraceae bacterium]|nr:tetratricopeptide repeat protein [Candidatus Fermentibacteraceae bacterium]